MAAATAAPNTGVLETEDVEDDNNDSTLGSDLSAYTETLRSSLLESVQENGRAYHTYHDGSYIMPEDEQEQRRLDMQHEIFLRTFGRKLILAPTPAKQNNVLDLGTGTGLWAIDYADAHPEAQVLGVDLSPIQPTWVPPNCKFEVTDYEDTWTYPYKFDLIHARMLCCCYSDGKRLFQQAFEALEPGGWLEFQDASMPIRADDDSMKNSAWEEWVKLFVEAMNKIGRDSTDPERYNEWMKEIGFENVVRIDFKWPQNPWPKNPAMKDLGRWHMVNTLDGIYGFTARPFTQILGMTLEEVEVLLAQVRRDIANRRIHSYWPVVVVYGQKPAT